MRTPQCHFYAVTQGACLVPNEPLLFSSLSFIWVFSSLTIPPKHLPNPPQLYIHDALYHHLVHIEDCHCHLLIITVTCTLRSAINTFHSQATAPQHLFRPLQSWWERQLAAKRGESHIQRNTQGINCSMTDVTLGVKNTQYLY